MALTEKQQVVLGALANQPEVPKVIAARAGLTSTATREQLSALRAKGLAVKSLNPTRWHRA